MSFIESLFTVIPSVLGGTIVYVSTKFILDNILEQKKIISNINYSLTFYANIYTAQKVNNELIRPVVGKFRELSAKLSSTITTIPGYKWLAFFHFVINP